MPVDSKLLSNRIKHFREMKNYSQEELAELTDLSRVNINRIENDVRLPSIDVLVDVANALGVSADDLLVDSLEHSASTADSAIHKLLLECNPKEEKILTELVKALKEILYAEGI